MVRADLLSGVQVGFVIIYFYAYQKSFNSKPRRNSLKSNEDFNIDKMIKYPDILANKYCF